MSNELTVTNPREVAQAFKQSGLFPDLKSEAEAYVKVLAGQEMGIGPMASMSGINVIQGKPTLSANLLAAQVKRHPAYDYFVLAHSNDCCRIEFKQRGETIGVSEFTMDDAKQAGVARGQNWNKYPKAMLFARALTQGVRWYCPDVTAGSPAYVPEELGVAEAVEVTPLDEFKTIAAEYEFTDEEKRGIWKFVTESEDNLDSVMNLLKGGNTSAVLAVVGFDAEEVTDAEVVE